MKKQRSLLLVLSAIILFSCSHAVEIQQPAKTLIDDVSSQKSIDDALADMYVFWDAAYGKAGTKSSGYSRPSVESINECSVITTKGGIDNEETLAYVVNFKGGNGYSILNAKKGRKSVLALTENGAIDADTLQIVLSEQKSLIENNSLSKEESDRAPTIDSPDYIYSFLAESILSSSAQEDEDVITTKTDDYPSIEILYTRSPLVLTKWGQKYPFNKSMKYWLFEPYTDQLRKRSPVGCGIIAAAQFMLVVNHPAFNTLVNGYSWSDFSGLCRFNNYSSFLYNTFDSSASDSQKTKMTKLAKGLSLIAEEFNAEYQQSITLVDIYDVVSALANMDTYYSNAVVCYPTMSMSTLLNMLDNGKPTYFRGDRYDYSSSSYIGHAWVVDGYLMVKESESATQYIEYPCLHFNWGEYGKNDGYYTMDSFNAHNRFSYDSVIDQSNIDSSYLTNYIYTRKFISY